MALVVVTVGLIAGAAITAERLAPPPMERVTGPEAAQYHPVAKVIDGDTVDVQLPDGVARVRLLGVDTPETKDPRKPVQCFGAEASSYSKHLLTSRQVRLEQDADGRDTDKYGRLLRYVFLTDGTFVNQTLVADGYAHEYTFQNQAYQHQAEFKQAETAARAAGRGLWSPSTCNGDTTRPAKS